MRPIYNPERNFNKSIILPPFFFAKWFPTYSIPVCIHFLNKWKSFVYGLPCINTNLFKISSISTIKQMASFQYMEGKKFFSCNHDHWLSRWFICFLKFHFGEHPKTPQQKTEPCPNKKKLTTIIGHQFLILFSHHCSHHSSFQLLIPTSLYTESTYLFFYLNNLNIPLSFPHLHIFHICIVLSR